MMIDDVSAPHPIPSCPPSGRSPSRSCSSVTTQFQGELLANRTRGIASQDVGLIPPSLMMMVMMRGVLKCGCVCVMIVRRLGGQLPLEAVLRGPHIHSSGGGQGVARWTCLGVNGIGLGQEE